MSTTAETTMISCEMIAADIRNGWPRSRRSARNDGARGAAVGRSGGRGHRSGWCRRGTVAVHSPELLLARELALVHALDTVPERALDLPDRLHELLEFRDFHRRGLIAAPHGAIQRDVPFDVSRSDRDRRDRRGKARFVSGV